MNKEVVIFGAGKIGRGFLGQLFYRNGFAIWFVDASDETVQLLNEEKRYRVDIAKPEQDDTEYITVQGAFSLNQKKQIQNLMGSVQFIATCVGANNIDSIALFIRDLLENRKTGNSLNWFICENALNPSKKIREVLMQAPNPHVKKFTRNSLGLIETQVLRSGMNPDPDLLAEEPLAVRMQDWWTLPFDKNAFVGPIPKLEGFVPKPNFGNELIRKIYTFNGTNGPISYIGWANGYKVLHESANAYPTFFDQIQQESSFGLIAEFGLDENEQREFAALAMKKYTDPALNDSIERNARDSRRKIEKSERLVGPALLCLKHGRQPTAYATAIAAAYAYTGSDDEGTRSVTEFINNHGIESAITKFSNLETDSELFALVLRAYNSKSYIFR